MDEMAAPVGIVALVGRPNVGKSTLFNRLVARHQAIHHAQAGVTRDRHYGDVDWQGCRFTLIDTGGYVVGDETGWSGSIREQVEVALKQATVLLWVVDVQVGVHAADMHLSPSLRRLNKPVLVVANKADTHALGRQAVVFYELGVGKSIYEVSAINGLGTGELLDAVCEALPSPPPPPPLASAAEDESESVPRLAFIGRPNTGKSTMLNQLLNEKRSITSQEAGTTRDALAVNYNRYGRQLQLIDTAGVRKRSRMKEDIEFYATMRAIAALGNCDVCVLLVDACLGLQAQDLHLLSLAERRRKGLVLCINKWDLIDKDSLSQDRWRQELKEQLGRLSYARICFCSALEKQGLLQLLDAALGVQAARTQRLGVSKLNNDFLPLLAQTPPPSYRGKIIRFNYMTQLPKDYPHFIFFSKQAKHVPSHHLRFMERLLRETYGFEGVPLTLSLRDKG